MEDSAIVRRVSRFAGSVSSGAVTRKIQDAHVSSGAREIKEKERVGYKTSSGP